MEIVQQITKLGVRADWLPFPHLFNAVSHEAVISYISGDWLPFLHLLKIRFWNIVAFSTFLLGSSL